MHLRAAEFFLFDHLTNRGFDQRRTGEIKPAPFGHQNLVAEYRQVSAARNAVSHHGGADLPARAVDFVARAEADLEKSRVFLDKLADPFPRRQAAEFALPLKSGLPAALAQERLLF